MTASNMAVLNIGSLNLDYVYRVDHFVRPGETLAASHRAVHAGTSRWRLRARERRYSMRAAWQFT